MEALDPKVILLVEHHPDPVLDQERGPRAHPPVAIQPRQLLAHQVPLVQQLPVDPVQPVEPEPGRPVEQHRFPGGPLHRVEDLLPLGLGAPPLEDAIGEIAGQPDPGREHEMAGRPARVEPADPAIGEEAQVDHSSTRSRSRSSAANSKFSVSTASRSCSRSAAARSVDAAAAAAVAGSRSA